MAEGGIAPAIPVHFDGAGASLAWSIPFAGLLLSIALLPLIAPHFWERHFGKVAAFWSFALIIPLAATSGFWTATTEILHVFLLDYLPFIILLFALFVVAGGIRVGGNLVGTPATNTAILAFGTLSASFLGTTGASMVLIRPIIRANQDRRYHIHVFVFFIFLVSNIGGSLTPLGDPPLFLGFLKGVDFLWTLEAMLLPDAVREQHPAGAVLCDRSSRLESRVGGGQGQEPQPTPHRDRRPAQRALSHGHRAGGAGKRHLVSRGDLPDRPRTRNAGQRPDQRRRPRRHQPALLADDTAKHIGWRMRSPGRRCRRWRCCSPPSSSP